LLVAKEVIPADEVVLQMPVLWGVPGLPQLPQMMHEPRASGWVWQRLSEMRLPDLWQLGPLLVETQLLD
jgi:hypothetical protein